MSRRTPRPPGGQAPRLPDAAVLHAAAVAHLARYGTTTAGLIRVLDRRIDRWARAAEGEDAASLAAAAKAVARGVVARLAASGAVNDAAFAEGRARSLLRSGRSRRAVAAHLATRGVDEATLRAALPDDPEAELAAALMQARRRRIGPFRTAEVAPDAAAHRRELAALARAGFAAPVAMRALRMEREAAEALVIALRRT